METETEKPLSCEAWTGRENAVWFEFYFWLSPLTFRCRYVRQPYNIKCGERLMVYGVDIGEMVFKQGWGIEWLWHHDAYTLFFISVQEFVERGYGSNFRWSSIPVVMDIIRHRFLDCIHRHTRRFQRQG